MTEDRKSLADIMAEDAAEDDARHNAARAATDGYTGDPCPRCGRIRLYLRRDGQLGCEKCEWVGPTTAVPSHEEPA